MESVAGATGNRVYTNTVLEMRDDVSVGYPLNVAMKQGNLFPHMVVQMTAIGEEAGALDTMPFKVAELYADEVNNTVAAITSLIEPRTDDSGAGTGCARTWHSWWRRML